MKKILKQLLLVMAAMAVLALAGCGKKEVPVQNNEPVQENKGPMQKAGEKVDNAAEKTGDAVKGAAEKTGDAVKGAAEATGNAVEGAADKTGEVVDDTVSR